MEELATVRIPKYLRQAAKAEAVRQNMTLTKYLAVLIYGELGTPATAAVPGATSGPVAGDAAPSMEVQA